MADMSCNCERSRQLVQTIRTTGEGLVKGLALLRPSSDADRKMIAALTRVAQSMTECPK